MGVQIGVKVEGVKDIPLEGRTDNKGLPDILEDWLEEEVLELLGVEADKVSPLRRAYADLHEESGMTREQAERESEEGWQSPEQLKSALTAIRLAIGGLRNDTPSARTLRKKLVEEGGNIWKDYLEDLVFYEMEIEDAIAVCDWAENQGRRVALAAW